MAEFPLQATKENLAQYGTKPLTRWLIQAAKERSTLTYGAAKARLEKEIGFSTIFPPNMGSPAGQTVFNLLDENPDVPPLNVLLVREDSGEPGSGAGLLLANYFGDEALRNGSMLETDPDQWSEYCEEAAADVYAFDDWARVFEECYGEPLEQDGETHRETPLSPPDGRKGGRGGGEGENHKALRLWVCENAQHLFQSAPGFKRDNVARTVTEKELPSGDRVDNVCYTDRRTIGLEVKSRDSNELDLIRGVYQCIKYKAVLSAIDLRSTPPVEAALVVEDELPSSVKNLARRLGIRTITVPQDRD